MIESRSNTGHRRRILSQSLAQSSDQAYLSTIIQEFNHSFVNPAVDDQWKKNFSRAEQVYATVADQMRRMAYGDSKAMVYESLVRAAVIVYFQQSGEDSRKNPKRIREEQRWFFWMDRLVDKLKLYEAQRTQYPTFSSYIPQIARFYRELAPRASSQAAGFDAKSAHVVKMEPFANHAQEVDPSVKTITIIVDNALDTSGYSISRGMDGDQHYPVAGNRSSEMTGCTFCSRCS